MPCIDIFYRDRDQLAPPGCIDPEAARRPLSPRLGRLRGIDNDLTPLVGLGPDAGTEGCTVMTLGKTATMPMGAKSFTGSYGTLANRLGFSTKPVLTTISVQPSADDVATAPVPVLPPAPVRFSM